MNHRIEIFCAVCILAGSIPNVTAFEVFPVAPFNSVQKTPDVDNGIVVWAEWVEGDWDVYGLDILDPAAELIFVDVYGGTDQTRPRIWYDRVVYQDNSSGDWDIWLADIADPLNPANYPVTDFFNDQTEPAIHGNTIVWQDELTPGTWDIYAADITEPNNASIYAVDGFEFDQTAPAVYRSTVVYQDDTFGDSDIWSADVWLKNAPQYRSVVSDDAALNQTAPTVWGDMVVYEHETAGGDIDIYGRDMSILHSEPFIIAGGAGLQRAPDISGHLVVWQDDRHGNFDIYGYNLITRQEFQITTDSADQTNPAISGSLVAWEDSRVTPANIYYTWLEGDVIADCPNRLTGDVNRDCRVNLIDFSLVAEEWLTCALEPADACTN
jgi:beta propeller repeat protein